jgi:PAS domain S-box-containing protein
MSVMHKLSCHLAASIRKTFPIIILDHTKEFLESNKFYQDNFSTDRNTDLTACLSSACNTLSSNPRTEVFRKNGDKCHIDWRLHSLDVEGDQYFICMGIDVSESEELARHIAETAAFAKVGYWRVDLRTNELFWSDEMYRIRSIDKDNFVPTLENVISTFDDYDRKSLQAKFEDCADQGKPFVARIKVKNDGDNRLHVETQGHAEYGINGEIIAVSGTMRDRTEEAVAQENLSNTEHLSDQLRRTLNTHALVSITDVQGQIIFANKKFCEVSGYSFEDLMGNDHRVLKSNFHTDEFYRNMWRTIAQGNIWQGEVCNLDKNGNEYWVYSSIVPFLNKETGKPIQYVSVRTEITEQKRMQEKLDTLFAEAQSASDAKSKFISNMSHELRTPLNHILGFSELIMALAEDEKSKENASYIHKAGKELLEKLNSVLQLTASHEYSAKNDELFDLGQLIDCKFRKQFSKIAKENNRKILVEINTHPLPVCADRYDILTIVKKLTDNSMKFTSPDDTIKLRVFLDGSYACISISDTGPGIPEEIRTSNLSPFLIGESVLTKSKSGMGVGLPLAKKLCTQNGGTFQFNEKLSQGSEIFVKFPIHVGNADFAQVG